MRIKRSPIEVIFDFFNHAFLAFWGFIALYPMLYVLFASLSDPGKLASHRGLIFSPLGLSFKAYQAVLDNPVIWKGYRNTILIVIFGTLLNIIMTALGAYFLSRKNIMFKNLIMVMIVVTMYFGGGLIPTYILVANDLHLQNNLLALIIPGAVSAYNMIVMRTSFQSIPASLEEAAMLDGASKMGVLIHVILPLSKAILAVMALWYGVGHWNSWFGAAIYLTKRDLWPLQMILREILIEKQTASMALDTQYGDEAKVAETIKFATIIAATVPILFVYPFLQRHFVKGVMIGSLKG